MSGLQHIEADTPPTDSGQALPISAIAQHLKGCSLNLRGQPATDTNVTERHQPGGNMSDFRETFVANHFRASCETMDRAAADAGLCTAIMVIADTITRALRQGGKLMIAGNGGSAADAQHIAGEFLSRLNFDRNPLPAIALTTDTSVLTAIGNDYGFEKVFARQVSGLGRAGDVFIAISTSGRSPNVLAALGAAQEIGIKTIGFTGSNDSSMRPLCDLCLCAPSVETPLIQQIHIVAAHAICGLVEHDLFGRMIKQAPV